MRPAARSAHCRSGHLSTDTSAAAIAQANGRIQLGGLDFELRDIVLEELNAAHIDAKIATDPMLGLALNDILLYG